MRSQAPAGFAAIGMSGGNIIQSGTKNLCSYFLKKFDDVLALID